MADKSTELKFDIDEELDGVVTDAIADTPVPHSGVRSKPPESGSLIDRVIKTIRDSVRPPAPPADETVSYAVPKFVSEQERNLRGKVESAKMNLKNFQEIVEKRKVYTAQLLSGGWNIYDLERDQKADPKITASWELRVQEKMDEIIRLEEELAQFLERRSGIYPPKK